MTTNDNLNALRDELARTLVLAYDDWDEAVDTCEVFEADAVLAHPAIAAALNVTRAALAWFDAAGQDHEAFNALYDALAVPADVREVQR
jgi:hypothetical protein